MPLEPIYNLHEFGRWVASSRFHCFQHPLAIACGRPAILRESSGIPYMRCGFKKAFHAHSRAELIIALGLIQFNWHMLEQNKPENVCIIILSIEYQNVLRFYSSSSANQTSINLLCTRSSSSASSMVASSSSPFSISTVFKRIMP